MCKFTLATVYKNVCVCVCTRTCVRPYFAVQVTAFSFFNPYANYSDIPYPHINSHLFNIYNSILETLGMGAKAIMLL